MKYKSIILKSFLACQKKQTQTKTIVVKDNV